MANLKDRRTFLKTLGGAAAISPFISSSSFAASLPNYTGKKLGIALVGLGSYATSQIGVALEETEYWKVTGIVTGSPEKIPAWKTKWSLKDENIYSYENFDKIADNKEIDVVYILLPNGLHKEYTIRAAKAGKHVICEKPMANTADEAEEMVKACKAAGVKLAVGYRLHFEPFNMQAQKWGKEQTFGRLDYIHAAFAFKIGDPKQWRLKKALSGGGPMMDVGIYCVQAARYVSGEEPISVTAQYGPITDKERFSEVEESVSWQMEFPSGTYMTGWTSYKSNTERLHASGPQGSFDLSPVFGYGPLKGTSRLGPMDLPIVHHQRAQMEAMGPMFLSDDPIPSHCSGEEGLRDMKIMMAIFEAAETGKKIKLG